MLARTSRSLPLSRACRCTSTSISPPCPHATSTTTRHLLTTTHYHDRLPLSPLELTRLRLPSEEALEYTAPLWEHQFQYYYESAKEQQEEGSSSGKSKDHEERWFATATTGVKRRDWRGWIRESRVVEGAGIVPGAPPPPPPPAPAAPIAASPSPSLRKDKQPASASPPSAQVEELERYISLTSLPSNNDASLSTTLPQDHLTRLQRTARQLGMKVVEGQLQAQLDAQPESATPTTAALSTEEQLSTLLNRTDARSTLAAFLSPSPSPSDDLLSTTFISSTPTLTPLDRLHSLWNAFSTSEQTDLHQLGDFQLSLSLLFHLSSPSNGESRTAHLELALSILRTLISCNALAEDQVASPPTYAAAEGMGKELVLRVVLMRTVVSAALGDGNAELAEKAVRELVGIRREVEGELRGEVLEATERDETESELILDVVEEMVDRHRIVRAETYRSHLHSSLADPSPSPSPSPTTSTSPASTSPHSTSLASSPTSTPSSPTPLLSIHSLLTCLPPPPSPSHHSTRLSPLLTSLSRESVALRRWDVLSSLFLSPSTSTTGQRTLLQTPRFARGLAKWFAGEGRGMIESYRRRSGSSLGPMRWGLRWEKGRWRGC
ncbi:hypothetical protein BCR35DRAFT_79942 [Leucosporidium creatinivorum]|uniref:Uncharacterized protein n=1 Tax=Leucosporidium creatinivorum TaxID=106004 RepID=A0A1Y2FGE5_9BASI|nr:hypothetical protein BCR35DRAFT_79942 [Leucosporidium creatinivorum]